MKGLLRTFLIDLLTLWLTAQVVLGLKLAGGPETYLIGALVLTIILIFVKPLLKLLLLPINFLTLGLFSWITNVAILYLLTLFVTQIKVVPFEFPGFVYQGFVIPKFYLGPLESFITTSFIISLISNFLTWLYR